MPQKWEGASCTVWEVVVQCELSFPSAFSPLCQAWDDVEGAFHVRVRAQQQQDEEIVALQHVQVIEVSFFISGCCHAGHGITCTKSALVSTT